MRRLPSFLLLLPLAACGQGADDAAGPARRDSAGVAIVENTSPLWAEGQAWTVAAAPLLDVGGGEDPVANFTGFASTSRLSDGRIVVIEPQGSVMKLIDSAGKVTAIGRQGGGPGEFQFLVWAGKLPGDSILTFEVGGRRFQLFGPDGGFVRNVTFQPDIDGTFPIPPMPVGAFHDGTVLTQRSSKPPFPFEGPEGSVRRDSAMVIRYDQAGKPLDSLGVWPSAELFGVTMQMGPQKMRVPMARPFSPQLQLAVLRDTVYAGNGDSYEVRVLTASGQVVRIVRRAGERLAVTPAMIAQYKEDFLGATEEFRQMPAGVVDQMKASVETAPYPETLPAFGRLLVAEDGHLWVQAAEGTSLAGLGGSRSWSVFAPDGAWLGDVEMPEGITVQAIGSDWVMGQKNDEDGAPHVLLYRLQRGS
ncbi:MAG TPA: hypothetical protein VJ773_10440 [Gemmatimonadales bacterium]|nr:hypothetical protein [Gemmatimonadales bacterium]